MTVRLCVFDMDGTLVDTFQDIAAAANYALQTLGRPSLCPETITANVGGGGRQLMQRCLPKGATEAEVDRAFDLWTAYYREHPADLAKLYAGVMETLQALRDEGRAMAVLSNKLDELTAAIADRMGLSALMLRVQGEDLSKPKKPDPALLYEIMEQAGAQASETLMVGDGDADILVAKNAGCRALGVDWGVKPATLLRELGAEDVLSDITMLTSWLKRNG